MRHLSNGESRVGGRYFLKKETFQMRKKLIYDLPTRLFHWIFSGLFVGAFFIVKTVDDENPVFSYHMLAGLLLVFVVLLRILWGLFGTRYALFSSLSLSPLEVFDYFKGLMTGGKKRSAGHNPASSWATILMFFLALSLGVSGILMATGQKETLKDVHELFANGFLIVVLLHVAGVILHAFRHRDGIALSMIDGNKQNDISGEPIPNQKLISALVFLVLFSASTGYLLRNYDSGTRVLNLFGTQLTLGENEENEIESESKTESQEEGKDDDGDDD
jgi:cytochrome b